jgi:hypothetical protein
MLGRAREAREKLRDEQMREHGHKLGFFEWPVVGADGRARTYLLPAYDYLCLWAAAAHGDYARGRRAARRPRRAAAPGRGQGRCAPVAYSPGAGGRGGGAGPAPAAGAVRAARGAGRPPGAGGPVFPGGAAGRGAGRPGGGRRAAGPGAGPARARRGPPAAGAPAGDDLRRQAAGAGVPEPAGRARKGKPAWRHHRLRFRARPHVPYGACRRWYAARSASPTDW